VLVDEEVFECAVNKGCTLCMYVVPRGVSVNRGSDL
jgi:hypothetical protein